MSASGIHLQNNYINLNVELGLNSAAQEKNRHEKNSKVQEKQSKNPDLEFEDDEKYNTQQKKSEEKEIKRLKKRDAEVRKHEMAHKKAAGSLSSSPPHYEYTIGPDGKRYITGGDVKIEMAPVPNDPEATIQKAQKIKRAALAPQNPSAQDRKVASEADKMERDARIELAKQKNKDFKKLNSKAKSTYDVSTYDALGKVNKHEENSVDFRVK